MLGARIAVPYATFTFTRVKVTPETTEFAFELNRRGIGERFYPMAPLDSLTAVDLGDALRVRSRRWRRVARNHARNSKKGHKTEWHAHNIQSGERAERAVSNSGEDQQRLDHAIELDDERNKINASETASAPARFLNLESACRIRRQT